MIDQIKTNNCNSNVLGDNESRAHYRLGDMILIYNTKEFLSNGSHKYFIQDERYKGTIMNKFATRIIKNANQNKIKLCSECVKEVIKEKNYETPLKDELVIHLRLGDVFGNDNSVASKKPNGILIIDNIKKFKGKNITIVTAFAHGKGTFGNEKNIKISKKNSEDFFHKILKNIPKDKKIKIKSSDDVDEDFIYLCMAKNLITTGNSCFAKLSGIVNKVLKKEKFIL